MSTCIAACLNDTNKDEEALTSFIAKLESGTSFNEPIKTLKLKTFADIKQSTTVKEKDDDGLSDNRVFDNKDVFY